MSETRRRIVPAPAQKEDVASHSGNGTTQLYDVDPSTGRKVPHKRINNAYLVHQRWLEKQERIKERKKARAEGKHVPYDPDLDEEDERSFAANLILSVMYTVFLAAMIVIFGGVFIHGDPLWGYRGKWTNWRTYFPEFAPEQLIKFKGHSNKPIYGDVFDVTPGRHNYGEGGAYHFFAGRDASRAYVTGCFDTHLTHDTRGFTDEEYQILDGWHKFYKEHPKYFQVGTVKLPPIDPLSPFPPPCTDARSQKPN